MGRANCPACGATVDVGHDVHSGDPVAIDLNTDASHDARRYRVVSPGPELLLERVPRDAPGDFYPDHHFDCPAHNAGRTDGTYEGQT